MFVQEVGAVSSQLTQLLISFKARGDAGAVARAALVLLMGCGSRSPIAYSSIGVDRSILAPWGWALGWVIPFFIPKRSISQQSLRSDGSDQGCGQTSQHRGIGLASGWPHCL